MADVAALATVGSKRVTDACEAEWDNNKDNCSGFVKAVALKLGIELTGNADSITDEIATDGWLAVTDGADAKTKAEMGYFVVAGLKGEDQTTSSAHGHVVVVVSGELAHGKYPTAYWGRLGSSGAKAKTLNWAWAAGDRDKVRYGAKKVN